MSSPLSPTEYYSPVENLSPDEPLVTPIEEATPAAHVPLALRECFDHVHWRITRSGSVPDYATVVAVEIMSSRWWPSRLPCPRRVGAAVIARLAETEGRF